MKPNICDCSGIEGSGTWKVSRVMSECEWCIEKKDKETVGEYMNIEY